MTQKPHPPEPIGKIKYKKPTGDKHRSALERAASADRAKIIAALESSTFSGHVMPYGPTKFVNGQNQGAAPVNTQVLGKDIQVILPAAFASAKAVFPMPPA